MNQINLKKFQRIPDPIDNEPPLKITTNDIGKKIIYNENIQNLEFFLKNSKNGETLEDLANNTINNFNKN